MYKDQLPLTSRLTYILIFLVLGLMIAYHIGFFYLGPFPGFFHNPNNGEVVEIFSVEEETDLHLGDFITSINAINMEEFHANPYLQYWTGLEPGDTIPISIEREGEPLDITWTYTGRTQAEFYSRLNSQWWLAYIFWLAGLAAYLIIRPRDVLWRLITAFNLLTALWFTAGSGPSRLHLWGGVMVTRLGIWATVPILIHLHWLFPKPFSSISKKTQDIIIYCVYMLSFGFFSASLIWPEKSSSYKYGLFLSLFVSIILISLHYVIQNEVREQIKIIFRFTLLAFSPIIITLATSFFTDISNYAWGASVAGLPLISFGYFFAVSRGRLGALELRANRAISSYLFAILLLPILIIIVNPPEDQLVDMGSSSILRLILVFITTLLVVLIYPFFQRFIESRILGIPLPPSELLQSYSTQITTSQDTANLSSLFDELILPSLLVRQSALIAIENEHNLKIISLNGLIEEQLPSLQTIGHLYNLRDRFVPPHEIREFPAHLHWIKVVFPLTYNEETIGVWLLGRRDPNDLYEAPLIDMLKSLAQQTSLALVNHSQTKRLRALYQVNIDRHENERARLARDLHDDTLNNLALLLHETSDPDASRDIDELITNLRKTIHGLRPEMLSYGLLTALQDLGDTLNERQSQTEVQVTLHGILTPLAPGIELHLFRIIQQACENALRHAQADHIYIRGQINEAEVHLTVEDDGIGFEIGENTFLSDLLVDQRYGLAGMHERADLIHAKMRITSQPGKGTVVTVDWVK